MLLLNDVTQSWWRDCTTSIQSRFFCSLKAIVGSFVFLFPKKTKRPLAFRTKKQLSESYLLFCVCESHCCCSIQYTQIQIIYFMGSISSILYVPKNCYCSIDRAQTKSLYYYLIIQSIWRSSNSKSHLFFES